MITPSITTFLITIINVGVLFFVLRAILFKPVTKFMEDRTKKIGDTIAQAEKDKNQAKLLLQQYEDQLKKADGESENIIRAARETAQQQASLIIADGKEAAEKLLANARTQIESEHKAAMARFRAEAAGLVIAASGQLLLREIGKDDNRRYAEQLLAELGTAIGK
ncbi:MAG: F0F1 ATP synthase subunit B [Treponema sp.]|jgi:F-type H+-transporting ATPase subunit b|nr:F0F1 ATP synthase subunit B [Treponema sp.]